MCIEVWHWHLSKMGTLYSHWCSQEKLHWPVLDIYPATDWTAFWRYPFLPRACKGVTSSGSPLAVIKLSMPKWTCEFCWILGWDAKEPIALGSSFIPPQEDLSLESFSSPWALSREGKTSPGGNSRCPGSSNSRSPSLLVSPLTRGTDSGGNGWESVIIWACTIWERRDSCTEKHTFFIKLLPSFDSSALWHGNSCLWLPELYALWLREKLTLVLCQLLWLWHHN